MSTSPRPIALAHEPRNNLSSTRGLSPGNGNGGRQPSPNGRSRRQAEFPGSESDTSRPLLDTEMVNTAGPPLAGPETDDSDDRETVDNAYPGVDEGFFSTSPRGSDANNRDVENVPSDKPVVVNPDTNGVGHPDTGRQPTNFPRSPGHHPVHIPDFPHAPGFAPGIMPDYAPTEFGGTGGETIPDINVYQHKKTLAQGFLDLALFSANANQLRYVLESYDRHPYYYPSVGLIAISLLIQVAIGVGLIWNSRYNVKDERQICIANKVSNLTIIGIFIVTVVNVFIAVFGVANAPVQIIGTS